MEDQGLQVIVALLVVGGLVWGVMKWRKRDDDDDNSGGGGTPPGGGGVEPPQQMK